MKWRILIVDDEEDVRSILRATLSDTFEVVEAHDGLDALEKLDRYEPDFVILDVMMPMMDGFDACAAIRRHPRYSELPVLFLTALSGKEQIKKGYETGANLYLTKPFDPARLLKNIEVHFDTAKASARKKRYTLEQIRRFEESGAPPVAPGSGEFDVRALKTERAPASAPAAPEPAPRENLVPRIMVVDDDPDISTIVDGSLGDSYEVVHASDGMQAIERLVRFQPDIMILDIMLPKLSGFQLCQSLRGNRAFATLPILICSAKCADRDVQFARRVGANDFLAKPFSATELVRRIQRLTEAPDFRVRPKSMSILEIRGQERPDRDGDVFEDADDIEKRRSRVVQKQMQHLLKDQRRQEVQEAQKKKEEDDKKGRSIFRFGRKG